MRSDGNDSARPAALLIAAADKSYGVRRARDLGGQIKAVAAAIEAVRGYVLAPDAEPWSAVPAIESRDEATRA